MRKSCVTINSNVTQYSRPCAVDLVPFIWNFLGYATHMGKCKNIKTGSLHLVEFWEFGEIDYEFLLVRYYRAVCSESDMI